MQYQSSAPQRRCPRVHRGPSIVVAASALTACLLTANAFGQTWNGGGADNNWSTAANWVGSVAPVNNGTASVIFSGATRLFPTNTAAYSLASLTIASTAGGNPFSFSGGQLSLVSGGFIQHNDDSLATFGQPFSFAGSAGITTASTGGITFSTTTGTMSLSGQLTIAATTGTTIQVAHGMTGSGSVLKIGSGTLVYNGTALSNTYAGATTVNSGLLLLSRGAGVAGNSFGSSVAGALTINGGMVRLGAGEQIGDISNVTIGQSGTLDVQSFTETVGQLNLVEAATITGTAGGTLRLAGSGSIVQTGSSAGAAVYVPIDFQGVQRTVVASGTFGLSLLGGVNASAGLYKSGVSSLQLSGAANVGGPLRVEGGSTFVTGVSAGGFTGPSITVGAIGAATGTTLTVDPTWASGSPSVVVNRLSNFQLSSAAVGGTMGVSNLSLDASNVSFLGVPSTLNLAGDVTVTNTVGGSASSIISGGTGGTVNLGSAMRTFTVSAGNTSGDLSLTSGLTSTATGGIVKAGTGIMTVQPAVAGAISNVTVNQGRLIFKTPGVTGGTLASGANVVVGTSAVPATLFLSGGGNTAGPINLTVNPGSVATVTNTGGVLTDSIGAMTLNSGVLYLPSSLNSVSLSGTITTAQTTAQMPFIDAVSNTGFRELLIGSNTVTLNVTTASNVATTGTFAADLYVQGGLSSAATGTLIKTGPGQAISDGANELLGPVDVQQGVMTFYSYNGNGNAPGPGVSGFDGIAKVGSTGSAAVLRQYNGDGAMAGPAAEIQVFPTGTASFTGGIDAFATLTMTGGLVTRGTAKVALLNLIPAAGVTAHLASDLTVQGTAAQAVPVPDFPTLNYAIAEIGAAANSTVDFSATLAGAQNYVFAGPGSAVFGGGNSNTYVGTALIATPFFVLSRSPNTAVITGDAYVYATATLVNAASEQIANTSTVQLEGPGSTWTLNAGTVETIGNLIVQSNSATGGPGAIRTTNASLISGTLGGTTDISGTLTYTGGVITGRIGLTGAYAGMTTTPSFLGGGQVLCDFDLTGDRLTVAGVLETDGQLIFGAGGTIAGTGRLLSKGTISGLGGTAGSATLESQGSWTVPAGAISIGAGSTVLNSGAMSLDPGSILRIDGALKNAAGLALDGAILQLGPAGSGSFTNTSSGSVTGPGLIQCAVLNQGVFVVPAGSTAIQPSTSNTGTFRLTSPSAALSGGPITNRGRLTGDGSIGNDVSNLSGSRVEPSSGGVLVLGGTVTNLAGGTLSAPANTTLVLSKPAGLNGGIVSLSGGTFDTDGSGFTNSSTGQITGYGTIATGGLENGGAVTLTGGLSIVNGSVTNDSGKSFRVQYNPAIFTGAVVNNGSLFVTSTTATFAGGYSGGTAQGGPPLVETANALAGAGSTVVAPGGQLITDGIAQAALTIQGTAGNYGNVMVTSREPGGLTPATGRAVGQSISIVGTLGVQSDATGFLGLMDLADNDLILTATPLSAAESLIRGWYRNGALGGRGLGSSVAGTGSGPDGLATLGAIQNGDGMGGALYATFDGVGVAAADVLVKYTYVGDANLDGKVDAGDLSNLLAGMSGGLTGWVNGDANYDGVVNAADLSLLLNSMRHQGASFGTSGGSTGAVPEPGGPCVALACVPLLLRRRR